MSTRCHILIADHPVMIYKHSDGYPEGVMPVLAPLVERFNTERGRDDEYLAAQIVRAFAIEDARHVGSTYDPTTSMVGWGLDMAMHGDEEFVYECQPKQDGNGYNIVVRQPTEAFWDKPILANTVVSHVPA